MQSWKLMIAILPPMVLYPTSILNQSTLVISSSPKQPYMTFESNKCQYRLIPTAVAFQSDLQCSWGIISVDRDWGSQKCSAGVAEHTSHRSVYFCVNRYLMAQNNSCHAGKIEHHSSFWSCLPSEQWIVPYDTQVCQNLPGILQPFPVLFTISYFTVLCLNLVFSRVSHSEWPLLNVDGIYWRDNFGAKSAFYSLNCQLFCLVAPL